MQSRREALKIIGAVGVTCAFPFSANELYGQHVHPPMQAAPQDGKPGTPVVAAVLHPGAVAGGLPLDRPHHSPDRYTGRSGGRRSAIYRSGGERRSEAASHLS